MGDGSPTANMGLKIDIRIAIREPKKGFSGALYFNKRKHQIMSLSVVMCIHFS